MRAIYYAIGFVGISIVILVHELGHCLAALFFEVPVKIFSIGFGPSIWSITVQKITVQLAVIPFGGYVLLSPYHMEVAPYIYQMFIMVAGIIFNILFSLFLFIILSVRLSFFKTFFDGIKLFEQAFKNPSQLFLEMNNTRPFIGPLGIISLIGHGATQGWRSFVRVLAYLNINIAFFNILPFPFLDGWNLALYSQRALGRTIGDTNAYLLMIILFVFFILLLHERSQRKIDV